MGTVASFFSAPSVSTPRSAYCCFARSYAVWIRLSLIGSPEKVAGTFPVKVPGTFSLLFVRFASSEIKFIDVRLREHHCRAEDNLGSPDLDRTEPPRLKRRRGGGYLVLRQQRSGEDRQVAEVLRVPQDDGLHPAVMNVRLVHVRERQAND